MTTQQVDAKHHTFGTTVPTSRLIELLKKGTPGDTFTDVELTECCGKDTRSKGEGYSYLQTAIRYVRNNNDLVWLRVRGANMIKCGFAKEILTHSDSAIRGIRRRSKKIITHVNIARNGDLNDEELQHANVLAAQSGVLMMMTEKSTCKKLSKLSAPVIDKTKLFAAFK